LVKVILLQTIPENTVFTGIARLVQHCPCKINAEVMTNRINIAIRSAKEETKCDYAVSLKKPR
jgi:LytS/YehU family sensor histidine kinase